MRFWKLRLVRLTVVVIICLGSALLLRSRIDEAAAYSIATVAFVFLTFRLRCEPLPSSLAFSLALVFDLLLVALQGPITVGGQATTLFEFPWTIFIPLLFFGAPLLLILVAPIASALAAHLVLLRLRQRTVQ